MSGCKNNMSWHVAQRLERKPYKFDVGGSNPPMPICRKGYNGKA